MKEVKLFVMLLFFTPLFAFLFSCGKESPVEAESTISVNPDPTEVNLKKLFNVSPEEFAHCNYGGRISRYCLFQGIEKESRKYRFIVYDSVQNKATYDIRSTTTYPETKKVYNVDIPCGGFNGARFANTKKGFGGLAAIIYTDGYANTFISYILTCFDGENAVCKEIEINRELWSHSYNLLPWFDNSFAITAGDDNIIIYTDSGEFVTSFDVPWRWGFFSGIFEPISYTEAICFEKQQLEIYKIGEISWKTDIADLLGIEPDAKRKIEVNGKNGESWLCSVHITYFDNSTETKQFYLNIMDGTVAPV